MAQIRLEDVSRVYSYSELQRRLLVPAGRRGLAAEQADRAFAERVAAQERVAPGAGRSEPRDLAALDHVDLLVPDGQTMAVVGPSGCGKSTLLRVIAGLDTSYTGEIYYDQRIMRNVPPKDRYIGMVFQNYALYPHFEGHGNLSFFFRVRNAPSAQAEEKIRITAEMMGFGFRQLLDRKPGTLSGGQQQRLAIARALVRDPQLFLFDEPLSNLDAKLRMQTRIEIKRLLRRFQITAVYVTHDQEEAISLGDEIAVMRDGRVEQVGTFTELNESPANAFVAGFLGRQPMNLAKGTVTETGSLALDHVQVPLPASIRAVYGPGSELTLGIRPEAAWLGRPDQPGPDGVRFPGTIEMVEPDFAHHTQAVRVAAGSAIYVVLTNLDPSLRLGDVVHVVLLAERLYFFETETGKRI